MSRIESLTKEQKERMPEYRDKWMAIGLSTDPADRSTAEKGIKEVYSNAGIKSVPKIIWCGSPLSSGITKSIVLNLKKLDVGDSVKDSVGDSVWDSVRASVRASVGDSVWASIGDSIGDSVGDSVWDSVGASVGDSVKDSVGDSVWASVWDSVGASVRASVWDSVGASVRASVRDSVWDSIWDSVGASVWDSVKDSVRDSIWGQHDANWLGFYDFFNNVLKLERQTEKLSGLWTVAQSAGWFIPYENICWISERHNVCKLEKGKIHNEGGPAIQYPDGFSIWGLNGVRVSQEIAETPFNELDSRLILTEQNAEVRKEIVRKIGIERVCRDLNAECVDKEGEYELLLLNLQDGRKRPYLKMTNPSIECYHVEGVHPDCDTVEKALKWRNGSSEVPLQLT
jgi:hypothetical protein